MRVLITCGEDTYVKVKSDDAGTGTLATAGGSAEDKLGFDEYSTRRATVFEGGTNGATVLIN